MSSSWHIPVEYQKFPQKTLLLCLSHRMGKAYFLNGHEIVLDGEIETEATNFHYSDREGLSFSHGTGMGTAPGTEPHNDEHYDHVFLNYLSEKLQTWFQSKKFESLIIFAPDDFKNLVKEKLPSELQNMAQMHGGNVVNMPPMEILQRLEDTIE